MVAGKLSWKPRGFCEVITHLSVLLIGRSGSGRNRESFDASFILFVCKIRSLLLILDPFR